MTPRTAHLAPLLLSIVACSGAPASPTVAVDTKFAAPTTPVTETQAAPAFVVKDRRALLDKLGRPHRMLVGHGNDLPAEEKAFDFTQAGIYSLPVALDLHYVYLSGVQGEVGPLGVGWPDYQPDGGFVSEIASIDGERGTIPMFTLYQHASRGERNFAAFVDPGFMKHYWGGVRLLFERLRAFDGPAMVHLEPDFWGYAQQASRGDDPRTVPVLVKGQVPECADLPDDVAGMGRCIVRLSRALAPKVALGMHASGFGALGEPARVAKFLVACGANEADFLVLETLDRDAGCFEAKSDDNCKRADGALYWDETNATSPNFAEHLAWVKALHDGVGLPIMWWQMPLGVPSDVPGGTPGQYRDNRVRYFFQHPAEFEAAGGFAAAFGVGAPNQTTIDTDGGQFAAAVTGYYANPLPLTRP